VSSPGADQVLLLVRSDSESSRNLLEPSWHASVHETSEGRVTGIYPGRDGLFIEVAGATAESSGPQVQPDLEKGQKSSRFWAAIEELKQSSVVDLSYWELTGRGLEQMPWRLRDCLPLSAALLPPSAGLPAELAMLRAGLYDLQPGICLWGNGPTPSLYWELPFDLAACRGLKTVSAGQWNLSPGILLLVLARDEVIALGPGGQAVWRFRPPATADGDGDPVRGAELLSDGGCVVACARTLYYLDAKGATEAVLTAPSGIRGRISAVESASGTLILLETLEGLWCVDRKAHSLWTRSFDDQAFVWALTAMTGRAVLIVATRDGVDLYNLQEQYSAGRGTGL